MTRDARADDILRSYTRAHAIDDGVLVEVPDQLAKAAGFELPIGFTEGVHLLLWMPPAGECHPKVAGQTYESRLGDMLAVAAPCLTALKQLNTPSGSPGRERRVDFSMNIVNPKSGELNAQRIVLGQGWDSHCGPYLTIMSAAD